MAFIRFDKQLHILQTINLLIFQTTYRRAFHLQVSSEKAELFSRACDVSLDIFDD